MSESICITLRGNYRMLEWLKTAQINVLEAYVNVEEKGLFYGTLIIIHEGIWSQLWHTQHNFEIKVILSDHPRQ